MGIKYVTVCNKLTESMRSCLEEVPRRGGFFNWMFLFKGEIRTYDDMLGDNAFEKYDVIHVNGAPSDQILVPEIRKKIGKSDTKIVFNNDHVCEVWEGWRNSFLPYLQAQEQADMVFGTEPYQVSNMIDRAVVMPHPHWIHMLKRMGRPEIEPSIGFLYHWWESKSYLPAIWSYKLKDAGINHKSKLFAHLPKNDQNAAIRQCYDELHPGYDYPTFMEKFMANKFVVDYCGYHTYGRSSVDMAAVGVPMIGSDRIESMRRCFPDLAIDPCDGKEFHRLAKKLWTDTEFYQKVQDYASEACEYYNYKNSKIRFLQHLEECEDGKR